MKETKIKTEKGNIEQMKQNKNVLQKEVDEGIQQRWNFERENTKKEKKHKKGVGFGGTKEQNLSPIAGHRIAEKCRSCHNLKARQRTQENKGKTNKNTN